MMAAVMPAILQALHAPGVAIDASSPLGRSVPKLLEVDPRGRERLREVIVQHAAASPPDRCHQPLGTANTYAARAMSEDGYLNDLTGHGNAYSRSARAAFGSFRNRTQRAPQACSTPRSATCLIPSGAISTSTAPSSRLPRATFARFGPARRPARHRRGSADAPEATLH